MSEKFNPNSKVTNMQGRDYLEVKWRLVWFRDEHPKGAILTEVISEGIVKATIIDGDGKVLATGHGTPKMQGVAKSRPCEGAETAAIGRALAHAGYGTQFTDEFEEGNHLADSPVAHSSGNGNGKTKTEAEKKQIAIDLYADLTKRAKAVNLNIPAMDAGKTSEQMKAQYNEQKAFVVDAETQAKVGK